MASTFPHVTITVAGKENGADASGELNTLSLGYGFHQAWIYSAMFSAGVFFGTDTPFTMLFDGAYSCSLIVLVISMIFFGIALLALGVTNQMFLRFYVSKQALGLSALLTCLGTYASFLVPVGGPLAPSPCSSRDWQRASDRVLWSCCGARRSRAMSSAPSS